MYNTLVKASNLNGHCPIRKSVDYKQYNHTFREARYLIRHLKTHTVDNANNAIFTSDDLVIEPLSVNEWLESDQRCK